MGNSDAKLLLIGLDNSGKSTIVSRLLEPDVLDIHITPTIGYKKDKITRQSIDFQIYDMSGESKYRDLWQSNASGESSDRINGIIFVVDCSDRLRLKVAKSELELILENKAIPKDIPYLFYANKCDLKASCTFEEVQETLGLKKSLRIYQLVLCSALSGKGIEEGFLWLTGVVKLKIQSK